MDQNEREAEMARVAAEGPLHDYLRQAPQTRAEWDRLHLQKWPDDLDRPSRLTPEMLDRKDPVRFDECGMTPERAAALRARAEDRFSARRAEAPIIPRDKT